MEELKQLYLKARSIPPFVALDAARHAESQEERNFYAFISDMNLQRKQWEYIRAEEQKNKDYYIRKAKQQRGLTDEQIDFFLQNHPRWDLLPYYACYVKKMGEKGALDEVITQFGSGDGAHK